MRFPPWLKPGIPTQDQGWTPPTAPPAPGSIKLVVAASPVGTTIEWYDNSRNQSYDLWFPHP
ncbi:hypothetical protein [Streptomyces sp. NBC_00354]|uniref:hypothetical protein n=1 Tax=Streptomyces sp. NBC_00354 TaxID=2975723 RepID=UPI002E274007